MAKFKIISFIVGILLSVLIVFALDTLAPTSSNLNINNTYPRLNETIKINLDWRDNISLNNFIFSWNLSGAWINESVNHTKIYNETCYQNLANESTSCGGLDTGSYRVEGECDENYPCSNAFDGNFSSLAISGYNWAIDRTRTNISINYTIPSDTTKAIWEIEHQLDNINITIPESCLNYNDRLYLHLKIFMHTGSDASHYTCVNSTNENLEDGATLLAMNLTSQLKETNIYWIFDEVAEINYSLNVNITQDIDTFSYVIYANDTSNNINVTGLQEIQINKIIPEATTSILNKPLTSEDMLNCSISFDDAEGDTWTSNETWWYKDEVLQTDLINFSSLSKENTSGGETWTCSARVYDTFNNSLWNNDTVVINDSTPPVLSELTADTPITVLNVGYLYVNCTDASSNIDSVSFTIIDPVGTATVGTTDTAYLGNQFRKAFSYQTVGIYNYSNVTCIDSSGNEASNSSVNILIEVQAISVPDTPTGGGGGGGVSKFKEVETNITQGFCGDGFCDDTIGEDPLSCPKDCVPDLFNLEKIFCTPIFNCGNWKTAWFTNFIIILILGGLVYYSYRSQKTGRLN